jgi:hypothetical protein
VVLIGTHIHIYIKGHVTRITVGIGWGYIDLDAFSEWCVSSFRSDFFLNHDY